MYRYCSVTSAQMPYGYDKRINHLSHNVARRLYNAREPTLKHRRPGRWHYPAGSTTEPVAYLLRRLLDRPPFCVVPARGALCSPDLDGFQGVMRSD